MVAWRCRKGPRRLKLEGGTGHYWRLKTGVRGQKSLRNAGLCDQRGYHYAKPDTKFTKYYCERHTADLLYGGCLVSGDETTHDDVFKQHDLERSQQRMTIKHCSPTYNTCSTLSNKSRLLTFPTVAMINWLGFSGTFSTNRLQLKKWYLCESYALRIHTINQYNK